LHDLIVLIKYYLVPKYLMINITNKRNAWQSVFVRKQLVLGVVLSAMLMFGVATVALAQETQFSGRVLAKGSKSNILILVKNSSKSTESIYEFIVTFTKGKPVTSIARGGWEDQRDGNTVTFTTQRGVIKPGGTGIFLIRVSDPSQSAFEWIMKDNDGVELENGNVPKIRIRESSPAPEEPIPTKPEISINLVRVNQGGQVIVTGKGFSALTSVQIFLDELQLTTTNTDGSGKFTTVVIIPGTAEPRAHMINAKDALGKASLIQILVEGVGGQPAPPQGQLILTVRTDKTEYDPGDTIKMVGTAILDSPVSLQVTDSLGGIICGANPSVNKATMTWDAYCFIPNNSPGGTYTISAKQIVHKTATRITVKGTGTGGSGSSGGAAGEDPGTLKLFTDKPSYKSGETVKITLQGARAKSIAQIIVVGPTGPPLDARQLTTDESGNLVHNFPLVAAQQGTYKITGKQFDNQSKKTFVVRATFEVTT
jgi:hypothetical protein